MKYSIDDEIAKNACHAIIGLIGVGPEAVSYEIQDEYKFVLFLVNALKLPENEIPKIARMVANLLNETMPTRHGEYTWMVNFMREGCVAESFFGGDLDSPDSGL